MNQVRLAEELLERIHAREPRYAEQGYLFVLASIEFLQTRLPARRHVTGQELAGAVRDYARDQFGLLAHSVLSHWGVVETLDIGRIVYTLVDVGLLITLPEDRVEDFDHVFEFRAAFDDWNYVWEGLPGSGSSGESPREVT